ncbi:MAG: esterase-like activity of phytase family protein [Cytophagales bacterium]|nr:esterase-like activity of phytase family protein [Cytophagales bacterium]
MNKKSYLVLGVVVAAFILISCSDSDADEVTLTDDPTATFLSFGDALSDQISNGDGNGIDNYFRNSGVVVNETTNTYFAVNGVHPVNNGDYSSYYTKSIVEASLETDEIVNVWSFDANTLGREVDMEGLTFAEGMDKLYIGDEYNFIYELDLATGAVTREWDLADIGLSTATDRGIEAITYLNGYFYAGIQEETRIYELDLHLDATDPEDVNYQQVTALSSFDTNNPPSGLFGASDGSIYMVAFGGGSASQSIYNYNTNGTLNCTITLNTSIGLVRPDGIYIDSTEEYVYIADSQGALNGLFGMYRLNMSELSCN